MKPLEREVALKAAREACAAADVMLVEGDDVRRLAAAIALWGAYAATGQGRTFPEVYRRVSWTLPGMRAEPAVLASLGLIPVVGPALKVAAEYLVGDRRAAIFLAPDVAPERIPDAIDHQLAHVGDIAAGGVSWCVASLLLAEVKAGDARCYGGGAAWRVLVLAEDPDAVGADIRAQLGGLGLDGAHLAFATQLLEVHIASLKRGVDPTGTVAPMLESLARHGWTPSD